MNNENGLSLLSVSMKKDILSAVDLSKRQQMDEEDLDMLLGRAEKLLGADYEDWMTTYNMSLDSTPLETLKQGGISMGAVNRELDNIEYIVQHRTY